MALYAPTPSYPNVPNLAMDAPSQSTTASQQVSRVVSRSEQMLIKTLRQHDMHERSKRGTTPPDDEHDYFSRAMDSAWSRSQSTNASPSRSYKKLSGSSYLTPPTAAGSSRSPSPATVRGVERDAHLRRRTPSPSPHPYLSSPRATQHATCSPSLNRTQTAPSRSQLNPNGSRPSTPSQHPRRSTSPLRSSHNHHRRESSNGQSPHSYQKRCPHEDLLRTRLEGVLAVTSSNAMDTTGTRSRGPSFSRTAPPPGASVGTSASTVTGDQWTWSQTTAIPAVHLPTPGTASSPRRSASISHSASTPQRITSSSNLAGMVVSPSRIKDSLMITPPPSPPHNAQLQPDSAASPMSGSPSRASSQTRATAQGQSQGLGIGRPSASTSRSSSNGPASSSCRVTPPPAFDARSASLALKQQHGYVSFCEIEGLGEPEGMDADESDNEENGDGEGRGRGRWWEVWKK